MTVNTRSDGAPPAPPTLELPTLRGFVRAHRLVCSAVVALVTVAIAFTVVTAVSSSPSSAGALSDASTCSQWASASSAQQTAYSRLYINEHSDAGFLSVPAVVSAIHADCVSAAYLGESDDVSVVAALKHAF
jgi:hypothetical protein